MTTQTIPDVGTGDGCGDGVPQDGVYCFVPHEIPEFVDPQDWVVADLDEDGRPELAFNLWASPKETVVARWHGGLEIIARGSPMHPPFLARSRPGAPLEFVGIRDYASDKIDRLWLEGGAIQYARLVVPQPAPGTSVESAFGVIDVDHDGRDEVLAWAWGGAAEGLIVYAYALDGDAWIPVGPRIDIHGSPPSYGYGAMGDVDGDGFKELVLPMSESERTNHLRVLRAEPSGVEVVWEHTLPFTPSNAFVGDVDGDGKADAVVHGTAHIAVARGHGNGSFDTPKLLELEQYSLPAEEESPIRRIRSVAVGDLDGDGVSELVVLFVTNGTEPIEHRSDLVVVDDPLNRPTATALLSDERLRSALGVGDINGDVVDDVFVARRGSDDSSHFWILISDP